MHRTGSRWIGMGWLVTAWVVALPAPPAAGDVRLARIIGDHLVLQRGMPLPIWGQAEPGEEVTVALGRAKATATADKNGRWRVTLPAMKAGGPHTMTVRGANTVEIKDILVGEVWVCSGQSNMAWPVARAASAVKALRSAKYPKMRLFQVARRTSPEPVGDIRGSWAVCSLKTARFFSAVAYFFGRHLHTELGVPVGLINASWGGTRIEPWTPPAGFAAVPTLKGVLDRVERAKASHARALAAAKATTAATKPKLPKHPLNNAGAPTALYNGMIHPIVPLAIRGAIWYQGESNCGEGMRYRDKMSALIGGWRKVWGQGDFPFYYVQLAPYTYGGNGLALPGIWEAQTAALKIKNTGMAVITDLGALKDIHPKRKAEVGRRLALWALAKDYGRKDLVYSGPLMESMTVEAGAIRVTFDHVGGGLASRDGKDLTWFEIAGADGKYVKASAKIDGDAVVVSSADVSKPVSVRFGWHQTAEANLINKAGLPASPFRTRPPAARN